MTTSITEVDISIDSPAVLELAKREHSFGPWVFDELPQEDRERCLERAKMFLEHLIHLAIIPSHD